MVTNNPQKVQLKKLQTILEPYVWIQGTIEQTVGTDIFIISDSTGKAKISKCDSAKGQANRNWIKKGAYCCVLGEIAKSGALPEIHASKIIDLSEQPAMKLSWDSEVKEISQFMSGTILPKIY